MSARPFLVGLGHKARHGKNTVADMLATVLRAQGLVVRDYAFAKALYDHCRVNCGMGSKDAPLLQREGMRMREEKGPDVWLDTTLARIEDEAPQIAIITDVRYQNEARAVHDRNGLLFKVTRYQPDGLVFVDPSRDSNHPSETDLDTYRFDRLIVNNGPLEELWPQVLFAAAQVREQQLYLRQP